MYYVFESDWSVLQEEDHMLWAEEYPEGLRTPRELFLAKPLPEPFRSMHYKFSIHPGTRRPYPDNWVAGTPFEVYSERLLKVLQQYEVRYESFMITLYKRGSDRRIEDRYNIFNLLDNANCFDLKRSSSGLVIKKLYISDELLKLQPAMVRDRHHKTVVIVHQRLKRALDDLEITGCMYIPIEEYSRGT